MNEDMERLLEFVSQAAGFIQKLSLFLPAGHQALQTVAIFTTLADRIKAGDYPTIDEVKAVSLESLEITDNLMDTIANARRLNELENSEDETRN